MNFGSIAKVIVGRPSEPQWLRNNPGWGTDVASDRSFFVTVDAVRGSSLRFFDDKDQWLVSINSFPNHQIQGPSLSPSNTQMAFYLRRPFFAHTWRAEISSKLEQDAPLP